MGQAPQHQPYTTHSSPQIQSFSPVHPAYPGPASTTQTSMITNQQQVRDGSAPPLLQPPSTYLVSPSSARASPGAALPQTGTMSPGLSMPAPSAPAYYTAADGNGNQVPHGGGPLGDSRTGPPAAPVAQSHSTMYTTATMLPISNPPANAPMGPPAKPAERPTKEYEYDVSDTLAGTGIDIRQEEQALTDYYASSFAPEARTGFAALPPGGRHSFYGAGIANQAAQATPAESQEQLAAQAAEDIWNQAAQRLANIRKNELEHPFLALNAMHKKLEKITKDHGLGLQLDMKNPHLWAGKMQRPVDFPQPKVVATMNMTPDGMILKTGGSWIPHDAFLCDQLALLSLATRHRLREKLEDADMAASNRQHTSHGEIPLAWADVGTSPNLTGPALSLSSSRDATDRAPNPRKRKSDGSLKFGVHC